MAKQPCVYIVTSGMNGTLYIGVTSSLLKRVCEHKNEVFKGFTQKYQVKKLVWFELHATMESAIKREKNIKNWKRSWKLRLIERFNNDWRDLYDDINCL